MHLLPRIDRALVVSAVLVLSAGAPADELERLHDRISLISPEVSEQRWLSIEWESDLWKARERAAEAARPIFLWEMDGHPLGCT
jgi:hypothetical protein